MLRHITVLFKRLLEMTPYMDHAVDKSHGGVRLEGRLIASKTVTLQISLEMMLVCQSLYNRSGA